jgi:hypothetical protein
LISYVNINRGFNSQKKRLSILLSIKDLDMKCTLAAEAAKFGNLELAITICTVSDFIEKPGDLKLNPKTGNFNKIFAPEHCKEACRSSRWYRSLYQLGAGFRSNHEKGTFSATPLLYEQ